MTHHMLKSIKIYLVSSLVLVVSEKKSSSNIIGQK